MPGLALGIAILALVVALTARAALKGKGREQAAVDAKLDAQRRANELKEELDAEIAKLREMLALVVEGKPLTAEMVREGRTWRDVVPTEAAELFAKGGLRVVDVRSPQETAQGVLPGALLVPIDQIEARAREIPQDGRPTLVYCAGGGRSAAACEYLSSQGYVGLMNLQGGIQSWSGPVVKPARS